MICPNCNYLFDLPPIDSLCVAHQYCPRCWAGIVNNYPNPPWHDIRPWLEECRERAQCLSPELVDPVVADIMAQVDKDTWLRLEREYGRHLSTTPIEYTPMQVDELVAQARNETPRREIFAQAPAAQILRDAPDAGIVPLDYTDIPFVE